MPIPDYQTIMLPLLKFLSDKKEHSIRECVEHISDIFNLTEEEKKELLPSGRQSIIYNRVGWARTYLKKAGLLESPRSGYAVITSRGLDVLKEKLPEINVKYLEKFPDITAMDKDRNIVRMEIEVSASDFINHKHDAKGCDFIVCWENDLVDIADDFPEIISLKDFVDELAS